MTRLARSTARGRRRWIVAGLVAAAGVGLASPHSASSGDAGGAAPVAGPPILGQNEPHVRYAPGRLLVGVVEDASVREVGRALSRAGATPRRTIAKIGARVVEVPPGQLDRTATELRSDPAVEYVEREILLERSDTTPNDALWSTQWGPRVVHAPRAWDTSRGSPSTVVAVLDTGVDLGHRDLRGAFVPGYDFVNDDGVPRDDHGHGTAVAGVIAARTQNEIGQAGACWRCSVMPVKVLGADGWGTTSAIAAGIVWATDHGADVISMSFGGPGATQTLASAVAYAAAHGVLLVAAAGNAGSTAPFFPAAYPGVLAVAATAPDDRLYTWSNRGAWVHVAAPGCNTAPRLGGGYEQFCGTSSATPIASGIAGLALSLAPRTPSTVLAAALERSSAGRLHAISFGRVDGVNLLAALELIPPVSLSRPRIAGTARAGETLRAGHGRWMGAERFRYRWRRCDADGDACTPISGVTGNEYVLRRADVGHAVRVVVRAANAKGGTRVRSRPSPVIAPRPAAGATSVSASVPPPGGSSKPVAEQGDGGAGAPACADCNPPAPPPPDALSEVGATVVSLLDAAGAEPVGEAAGETLAGGP